MAGKELKEKGNTFIKEKRYQEAINCYTTALASDSSSHTVLSNRSLAFFKLGKLKEALDDANKCIGIAPEFGRGYLRKATALNGLGNHTGAMLAAEEGYKCRQSDLVCKECVSQWLVANQTVHQKLISQASESFGIPTGFLLLSENMYMILHKVTVARVSAAGMTHKLMKSYLLDVVKEIDSLLSKFGHKIPSSMLDWIHSLSLTIAVDPQTDSIPEKTIEQIIQKGSEFSDSLLASIDPILYPVLGPLIVLCVIIINCRSYTLDCMNSGHHERMAICESLLPLFRSGILHDELYIVHHLCTFVGLLGSFHGRRTPLTADNIQQVRAYSQRMRMVLAKLTPRVWEYHELKKICLNTLAIIEQKDEKKHGDIYITAGVEAEVTAKFGGDNPATIITSVEKYVHEVRNKRPTLFTVDDGEYLLYGSCKFI